MFSVRLAISFTGCLIVSLPALAGAPCSDNASGNPREVLRILDEVEVLVPVVPPEEASYLEKENNAAFIAGSPQRMDVLTHRPYFYAWQLHEAFATARWYVKQDEQMPDVGVKMRIQMASRVPNHLSFATSAWDDYFWAGKGPRFTGPQFERATKSMATVVGTYGFYIWCLADLIPER